MHKKENYQVYFLRQKLEAKYYFLSILGAIFIGMSIMVQYIIGFESIEINGKFIYHTQFTIYFFILSIIYSSILLFSFYTYSRFGRLMLTLILSSFLFSTNFVLFYYGRLYFNCNYLNCDNYNFDGISCLTISKLVLIISQFGIFSFKELSSYFSYFSELIFEKFSLYLTNDFYKQKEKFLRIMSVYDPEYKILGKFREENMEINEIKDGNSLNENKSFKEENRLIIRKSSYTGLSLITPHSRSLYVIKEIV